MGIPSPSCVHARASADASATAGVLLKALESVGEMGLDDLGDLFRVAEIIAERKTDDDSLTARAAES